MIVIGHYKLCGHSLNRFQESDISKLESVQRRALRFVMSNYDRYSSVSEMLSRLHLSRSELRQNAYSLSIFYKLMNNLVDVSLPDCISPSHVQNRGHNKKIIPILPRIDAYKFSFYPRVLSLWNTLPSNIMDAKTF